MLLRTFPICVLLCGAAACSPQIAPPQAEEGAQAIDCALGEGSGFGPDCLVERAEIDGKRILVVRHPDGGFRRFEQLADGRGLAAMDGADTVTRDVAGDVLEIALAADRYRFPARVRGEGEKGN